MLKATLITPPTAVFGRKELANGHFDRIRVDGLIDKIQLVAIYRQTTIVLSMRVRLALVTPVCCDNLSII